MTSLFSCSLVAQVRWGPHLLHLPWNIWTYVGISWSSWRSQRSWYFNGYQKC